MSSFTNALHDRLTAADASRADRRDTHAAQMEDRTRRAAVFEPVAEEVHRILIRPMMEEVARAFDNCTVEHLKTPVGYSSRCLLARTDRYPASTELAISIGQEATGDRGLLTYRLGIIPELMDFTKSDSWTFALEPPALDRICDQLTAWLLRFTDTYLRLESEPAYQEWCTHLDPVCGMRISGAAAANVLQHAHRKIYFCSAECRTRFETQPGLYLTGEARLL